MTSRTSAARGSDVAPEPPSPYSSEPGSAFHRGAVEVVDTVAALTPEQRAIALHWSDGRWSITPPGLWLAVATAVLAERSVPFDVAAETYLRLTVSQHDALVSCWWTKYPCTLLRPITHARRVLGLTDWLSPIKTPSFPEYPSGHSAQSAAAAEVLTAALSATEFVDRTQKAAAGRRGRTRTSGPPPGRLPSLGYTAGSISAKPSSAAPTGGAHRRRDGRAPAPRLTRSPHGASGGAAGAVAAARCRRTSR